jgi:CheY-like chemotaxis protein/methyl-accepting chemotaxis protein
MTLNTLRIGMRLAGGFGLLLVFTLVIGLVSVAQLRKLTEITEEMYNHPLTVSNAVRDIRIDVTLMERAVRDLVLVEDQAAVEQGIAVLDSRGYQVLRRFDIVAERFLGSSETVERAKALFNEWEPIRKEIIRLVLEGDPAAAIELINSLENRRHLARMDAGIQEMIDFASGKADFFFSGAQDTRDRTVMLMITMFAAILAGGTLVGWSITRSITRPLAKVVRGVEEIAGGNLDYDVDLESPDEIGMLARSFRKMQANLKMKAEVARQIAAGNLKQRITAESRDDIVAQAINQIVDNFSAIVRQARLIARGDYSAELTLRSENDELRIAVNEMVESLKGVVAQADRIASGDYSGEVPMKSENDKLANSLNRMTTALRQAAFESEHQNWQKTGKNGLNEAMRGEIELSKLGAEVIRFLATYLGAAMGALYIAEEDKSRLTLAGSYAFSKGEGLKDGIAFGEGLVGQAAAGRELISVTDLPEDYTRIASAIGDGLPRNVVVAPFMIEEKVWGVIELGSFKEFSEMELEFLTSVSETVAVAINMTASRARMAELLEQMRLQAELLQQQQEELLQSNEELESQAKALLASEAGLQVQQEELRVTNEELEEQRDAIQRNNEALERARREIALKARDLETASQYKSEFLANMSHELRTPLNSVLILSQLLVANRDGNLTDKQVEFSRTIHSSGADLLNLINEVLDLSKVEAGKMDVVPEDINLRELLAELLRPFESIAEKKGLQLVTIIEENLPKIIYSDSQRLRQILRNLVSNAVKFTEKGRVTVSVGRPTSEVELLPSGLDPEQAVVFSVADTGIGIAAAMQPHVFKAFHQADGTTSRRFGGTGLGLSISRVLARLLGGEIRLTSEEGRGSTFTLFLPERLAAAIALTDQADDAMAVTKNSARLSSEQGASYVSDDRQRISPGDKSLLIIEDDAAFAEALVNLAHLRGFKCLVAGDGETGLSFADFHKPSAIILDIGLPGMDGWAVMDRLKANPATRHVPVHFISATDKQMAAMQLGAVGYLVKPVSVVKLEEAFSRIEEIIAKPVKRLLVVEDDTTQRQAIMELIGNGDVVTNAVATGTEALERLRTGTFDCMILDLGLADMSGFDLLASMRDDDHMQDIPIIIYTGKELTEKEDAELRKYAESIIVKGVRSPERLLDETTLFLHRVQRDLPDEKRRMLQLMAKADTELNGRKILLVDDDMRNVFALSNVLELRGVRVVIGRNGADGLAKLDQHPDVDLVLMDIMMPEMDGYEAMRRIRQDARFAKLPIIALTAKAMKGDRAKCLEAGASDYLTKPVDTDRLLSLLRVWLHR